MISDIKTGLMLPEYITMQSFEIETARHHEFELFYLCKFALETLNENGKNMYKVEKTFTGDFGGPVSHVRYLYRLDTDVFSPLWS